MPLSHGSTAAPPAHRRPGRLHRAASKGSARLSTAVRAPFGDVPGPFPVRPRRDTSLEDTPTREQERGMRAFWWDGFWASASETVIGNYLALYLLAFGASNSQVGLLASLSGLFAALAFFPGAKLVERVGHRKGVVVWSSSGARICMLAMAAIPFVGTGSEMIWLVIAIASLRGFWAYFSVPAWTSLTADVVPIGIRGRFLASRNVGMSLATLAAAPLMGFLIDHYTGFGGWQLVWLIAFATGAISTWCYARIPEPPQQPHVVEAQRRTAERGLLRDILADRNFTLYLGSVLIWNLALQSAGPFFNVYLVKDLHASTFMVGVLSSLPAFTGLAGFVAFGRLMDRRGTKWVMTVNGLLIPLLPLMWVLVTAAWQVMFINAFGGMIWAGYNLALSNMVMIMAPPEKRARYAAAFQTVTFAGAFVGPLLGGYIIDAMGFQSVFILSAAGRAIGTIVLLRFVQSAHERSAPEGAAAAGEAEAAA